MLRLVFLVTENLRKTNTRQASYQIWIPLTMRTQSFTKKLHILAGGSKKGVNMSFTTPAVTTWELVFFFDFCFSTSLLAFTTRNTAVRKWFFILKSGKVRIEHPVRSNYKSCFNPPQLVNLTLKFSSGTAGRKELNSCLNKKQPWSHQ